jgi:glycosyltransferase involved in cell wall biosynthesis
VPVYYFRFLTPPYRFWGQLAARSYRRGLARWIEQIYRSFPFDLVHAHTAYFDGNAGAWLSDRFRVPLVLTEHTGPFSTLTEDPAMRAQTEYAINRAGAVLAVSERLKRDILAQVHVRNAGHISVLGNGMDPAVFHPTDDGPPRDGTVRALWVGGYLPVKQPFLLVDAFAVAVQKDPRLRLTMIGRGPLEQSVRDHVKAQGLDTHVTFYPSGTRTMIAGHMRRHHFLVLASESETFGIVVIESLGCGRPVLSTRCGGPQDIIRDDKLGELADNSISGLAQGFLRMSSRLAEFNAATLHEYAKTHYAVDMIARRLQSIYASHLSR